MELHRASSDPGGKRQVRRVRLARIVSGGQTGADRAALDFAIQRAIPHGGWCPQGRLAEDGHIGAGYSLRETPAADYMQRTEWNVRDSDGTVIFSLDPALSGGSKATEMFAAQLGKPCLHLSGQKDGDRAAERLTEFVERYAIRVLNVAGPRSSVETGVASFVTTVLNEAIAGGVDC